MCSVGVFFFPVLTSSYQQKVEVPEVLPGRLLMFFFGPCFDSAFMYVTVYVLRAMVYSGVCVF